LEGLLRELQRARGMRGFGVCRTCRFFTKASSSFVCGLTQETLSDADSARICREHEAAA